MIVYNENGKIIKNYDLTKGYLISKTRIKKDAQPIDNVNKFAWADDDYEEIQIYKPFNLKLNTFTPEDDRDSLLVDLELRMTLLELGI